MNDETKRRYYLAGIELTEEQEKGLDAMCASFYRTGIGGDFHGAILRVLMSQARPAHNDAIKHLSGKTDKAIKMAVLNACTEFSDLVPQNVINEAVARIKRGISMADKAMKC